MKNFLLGLLTGLALIALALAIFLAAGLADVGADSSIPTWASRMMYSATHASVRRCAPKQTSPLSASDDTLITGGKLYLNDCVGCHGEPGKPPSDFGASFYPPAPQFPSAGTVYEEPQVFWIAKHGIRRSGMSAQEFSYADKDLWALAAFIRRFPDLPPDVLREIRKPSVSNPSVTPQ